MTGGNIGSHQRVVSGEWHRPAWGGTCRPSLLLICPGRGEDGAAARAAIWPPAWELGGEVRVRCQYGSARAVWEQMFCGVFAPAQLRRGRRVYQWLEAFRGATDSDLRAAACQSPPAEALRGPPNAAPFGILNRRKIAHKHNRMSNSRRSFNKVAAQTRKRKLENCRQS